MRACIIGLGQVAWKYDHGVPTHDGHALTHLSAYHALGIEVIGGIDLDPNTCSAFTSRTGIQTTETIQQLLDMSPDIVSITSPNRCHSEHLRLCLDAGVKRIWLEKPAAGSAKETKELADLADACQARVLVGFQRRYLPCYQHLISNNLGDPVSIEITYSRGLQTNGVHLVDLLSYIVGDRALDTIGISPRLKTDDDREPSPSALFLIDNNIPVSINGMDIDYHAIDITMHYRNGRISVRKGGVEMTVEQKIPNPQYPNFFRLGDNSEAPSSDQLMNENALVFGRMVRDLIEDSSTHPISNLYTAARSQEIVETMLGASR